jgi:2-dehydro-3-deoxy-L-rhamnonate dehydrogenase (NAD+)
MSEVAVVTGGGSGIGAAIARRLAHDGYRVVVTDRDRHTAEAVARSIRDSGGAADADVLDVTSMASCESAIERIRESLGRLDVVIACAGAGHRNAPLWELSEDEWIACVDLNLTGTFRVLRFATPLMISTGGGRMVLISSVAGKEGTPHHDAYTAAKGGMIALAKSFSREVVDRNIVVNVVTPGLVETRMSAEVGKQVREHAASLIPMKRMAKPEEVAAMVSWLASPACSFSTGATFDISGGRASY